MNKGFEELNKEGIKGIATFWLRCLLFLLSIGVIIFSIYWMAVTSNKIWISSNGSSLLVTNIFLALTSIGSFVFLLLCRLNKQIFYTIQFTHHCFAVFSFIAQVICCILMSLSNSSHAETYLRSIEDYCERNPSNSAVIKFVSNNPSSYSRFKYVAKRSTDLYSSVSSIFGIWFASTIIYLICSSGISDTSPEKLSLLNNQQDQPQIQQSDQEQNQEQDHSEHENVQPWVQNPDQESNSISANGDQEEINITSNPNVNQRSNLNESQRSNLNESQRSNQNGAVNNQNNPEWVAGQGGGKAFDEYSTYDEES